MCPGQLEFFYDQSPNDVRSLCSAFCLLTISLRDYLNFLILTIVTTVTIVGAKPGWIPDNLNKGRFDSFFLVFCWTQLLELGGVCFLCHEVRKEEGFLMIILCIHNKHFRAATIPGCVTCTLDAYFEFMSSKQHIYTFKMLN